MQTVLVIIAIAVAASYLGSEVYKRFFAKESSCDGCAMSPTSIANSPKSGNRKKS